MGKFVYAKEFRIMKYLKIIGILFVAWAALIKVGWSKSITLDSTHNQINGLVLGLNPGDTILLLAGEWEYITFRNVYGTYKNPIVAINYNGKVKINTQNNIYYQQGINIKESNHFILSGAGAQNINYGVKVLNTNIGSGLDMRENVHHIQVNNIEITNTDFAGIMVKEDPRCDGRFTRGTYVLMGININSCYIHHTNGEGIYAGMTGYYGRVTRCNGEPDTLLGVMLDSLVIDNNIIKNTNREALQVFSTYYGEVTNNVIDSFGVEADINHSSAVSLGLGSGGVFAFNHIKNGYGHGVNYSGKWNWLIYSNVIDNSGMLRVHQADNILACGIYADAMDMETGQTLKINNNTVVNSKNNAVRVINPSTPTSNFVFIKNNVLVGYGQGQKVFGKADDDVFNFKYKYDVELKANYNTNQFNSVGFVDWKNGDYRLSQQSNLVNQGARVQMFANTDIDNNIRIYDDEIDIGAYECQQTALGESLGLRSCTKTLFKNAPVINANDINYQAGDTFCLMGDKWPQVIIENFEGELGKPVVFRNAVNKVIIDGTYYGIELNNNNYVKIDKCQSGPIGWDITNTTGNAISINGNNNLEITGVFTENSHNAAVLVKENANVVGSVSSKILIDDLTINQTNGKAVFHFNRVNANTNSLNDFSAKISIKNCVINAVSVPVLMLNHEDLELEFVNNSVNSANALVFDVNKTHKANICQNHFTLNSAQMVDFEGRARWMFHNNIVEGTSSNNYLIKSRTGINLYKQRSARINVVNNTFNVKNITSLWSNKSSMWDTNTVDVCNNAFVKSSYASMAISNFANSYYTVRGNTFVDSHVVDDFFSDVANKNYTLHSNSALVNSGVFFSDDTLEYDYNGNAREGNRNFDIGAYSVILSGQASDQGSMGGFEEDDEKEIELGTSNYMNESIRFYPNPSQGMLYFKLKNIQMIKVYNQNGKLVEHFNPITNAINLSHLPKAAYVIEIHQPNSVTSSNFLLK
ncbi:MAG: T9SS type A sorting domain-containing protein [Bacteroidia bacterium]